MLRTRILALIFGASVMLAGCGSFKAFGVGRRPFIPELPALVFTAEETIALTGFAGQNPVLFKRLQGHANANADAIHAYNKEAVRINLEQEKALGASDDEIKALTGLWRQKYNIKD